MHAVKLNINALWLVRPGVSKDRGRGPGQTGEGIGVAGEVMKHKGGILMGMTLSEELAPRPSMQAVTP
jgi:hypothetical protein